MQVYVCVSKVIHALRDELQERGVSFIPRNEPQNALVDRLAQPMEDGRMSTKKILKIFQD